MYDQLSPTLETDPKPKGHKPHNFGKWLIIIMQTV